MAVGLQFKENLSIISGGYPREGVGSNGVTQDWTETSGDHGSSTVTYWYHDSATMTDANSTIVYVTVTDEWTAVKRSDNTYEVTVHSVLNSITRERIGSPSPLSVSIFVRRERGGPNIWTSGGCVSATTNATHATNVDLGTYTIILPPGQPAVNHGAIYYRSNVCGYDGTNPPSIYVDEYWLGINFRNTLPPDYRPGKIRSSNGESTRVEEGTSISVNNTLEKPFAELQLNGNTEQAICNGINKLPLTMTSQTLNGVTFTVNDDGSIGASGTATARTEPRLYQSGSGVPALVLENGTTYHNSMDTVLYFYSTTYRAIGPNGNYTPSVDETVQYAYIRVENGESVDTTLYPQLEIGTSSTPYVPYDGGVQKPTPANPSAIQTVTGTQTISVSNGQGQSQSYTIDLGSYELCKIGNYQDYIYQSGTAWFIHKATGKTELSDQTWTLEDTKFKRCQDMFNIKYVESDTELGEVLAEDYLIKTDAELTDYPDCLAVGTDYVSVNVENDTSVTPSGLLYYVLDEPEDDKEILEPTLIAQLDALKAGGSYNGSTAITVSGDLASPLKVGIRVSSGEPTWASHNREAGWAGIWDNSTFKEMRTEGGPNDTGNPPTIYRNDFVWHNQRKIGQE